MSIEPRRVPTPFLPVENAPERTPDPASDNLQPAYRGSVQTFVFETPRSYQEPRPLAAALPEGPRSTLWELASTALNETLFVENINARDAALAEAVGRVRKQVYDETGVSIDDLPDPFVQGIHGQWGDLLEMIPSVDQGARSLVRKDMLAEGERNREAFNLRLAELKLKYPDKNIPASLEDAALGLQREIYAKAEDARARAPGGVEAFAGGLAGSLAGSFGDPLQVATLPIGFGSRTIVGAMVKEAAVNAGITGGLELVRDKAAWKDVTGREYTAADLFDRMATAAAFGGGLGAAGKTLQQGLGRLFFDRSAFEVFRTKYDALPENHPFRQDETFRRSLDAIGRDYREQAERPATMTADADAANRASAARTAAEPDAPAPQDPLRDELVAMLDRGAGAEEIWDSEPVRAFTQGDANTGVTLERGQPIPEGRTYSLPDADGVPRDGDLDGAVDWLLERAGEAAGPEGVARERKALMIIGYPGAGKSTFVERFARRMRGAFVDADLAKTIVPEYEGGRGSQRVHNESSVLRSLAVQKLMDDGDNIVFETVGGSAADVLAQANKLKAAGYSVNLAHVRVDPDEAVRRSWRRYLAMGRSIQPQYARSVYGKVAPAFDELVESGAFSGYLDIDYSGPRQDAAIRPLPARLETGPGVGGPDLAGDGRGASLTGNDGEGLLGEAQSSRGIPDLEDEVGRIVEAARLAAQRPADPPPPTSPAAVFDSTLDPSIARAADDPTDANIAAAIEAIERETAAITGEGVDDDGNPVAFSFGVGKASFAPIIRSAANDLEGVDPSEFADVIRRSGYAAYRLPAGTETARLPKGYALVWHSSGAYAMTERNIADRMRAGQANFARIAQEPQAVLSDAGVVDAPPPAPPATADTIRAAASAVFGDKAVAAFDIAPPPKWAPEGAKAYTVKKTGRIVLIEGRVTAAEVPGLVLHEIGAHAGLQAMLGEREWSKLLDTAMKRAEAGKGAWAGVLENIPADTPIGMRAEEALGYFLEQNVDSLQQHGWWRELVQRVRAWASKALPWLTRELTDNEIRDMAIASVRERARRVEASALDLAENLEPMPGDVSGRIFGPGAPDAAGFITSAERAFVNLPKKFAGAKSLTPDQWRSGMKAGGASAEAMRWQVEPALASIGAAERISREAMEEALARVRMAAHSTSAKRYIDGYEDYVAPGKRSRYRHEVLHFGEGALGDVDYKSHNWPTIPNAVGHIRMTDRVLADGTKSLHVEELQSDLHQEGAQHGYLEDPDRPHVQKLQAAKVAADEAARKWHEWKSRQPDPLAFPNPALSDEWELIADPVGRELFREANAKTWAIDDVENAEMLSNRHSPPRAPMENWEEPFVRHVLQLASREGYDTVTFPTWNTLHIALKNEGTRKFYDERLPKTLARVAKSLGLQVEKLTVSDPLEFRVAEGQHGYVVERRNRKSGDWMQDEGFSDTVHETRAAADAEMAKLVDTNVPAIHLTPEARGQLLNGVVAYSQGSPTGKAQPAPAGSAAAEPKKPAPGQTAAPHGPPSPELARQRWIDALQKRTEKRLRIAFAGFRNGSGEHDAGEFLQAILDYQGQGSGLNMSVDGLRKTIVSRSLGEIEALLHHFRAGTGGRRVNKADLENFVKEMFGEDTKDPAAKALAQATAPILDKLRQRFNNAGGMIGKLDRWGLPQAHDALAMRNWIEKNGGKVQGREALRQRLFNALDVTRMRDVHTGRPMSAAQVWDALDTVIQDMLTDGWATRTPSRSPATPGMLANQRADHRFLIFKDATTWLDWQREFGSGDPVTALVGHVERMARDIAAMEILGPNPTTTIEWLKQMAQQQGARAALGQAAALPKRVVARKTPATYVAGKVKRMDEMWQNYTGSINVPVNESLARKAATLRNVLTSATLGSALLSAMPTDPVFQAFARWGAGTRHTQMVRLLARQTLGHGREAAQLGLIMDHALATFGDDAKHARELSSGDFTRSVAGQIAKIPGGGPVATFLQEKMPRPPLGGGWSSVLAGQVLAVSALTPWTRGGRQVFQMGFLADMGNLSGDAWADLPKAFKRTFERYGITEPAWETIRQSPLSADGFMTPQNIQAHAGLDLADRVVHMILQETEYAVPSGTLRSRSFMRGLDKSGTFMGELRQSGRMFLSFSATLPMLYGYRLMHQFRQGKGAQGAFYFAALAGTLMLGGALRMQLANIRDGKDLQDMSYNQDGGLLPGDFWKAAFLQGGGLGIYGDFLFSNLNRMDRSIGETIAGPAVGFLSDAQEATLGELQKEDPNLASTVGRLILGNVPGSSLWYLKGAYDRWVEDAFQRLVDPKADEKIRRQARKLQTTTGQGYWWSRTGQPSRAPQVAEAPEPQPAQ